MKPEKTLTVVAAARRLGVMPRQVYDLLYGGRLAATKVRGRWRISVAAVETRREQRLAALNGYESGRRREEELDAASV
jgi:excisionase family DNA binding protein